MCLQTIQNDRTLQNFNFNKMVNRIRPRPCTALPRLALISKQHRIQLGPKVLAKHCFQSFWLQLHWVLFMRLMKKIILPLPFYAKPVLIEYISKNWRTFIIKKMYIPTRTDSQNFRHGCDWEKGKLMPHSSAWTKLFLSQTISKLSLIYFLT